MLLVAFCCQQAATMSAYNFTQRAIASPDAPQKLLVRKRARSGGAEWVRVSRRPSASPAKHLVQAIPWRKAQLTKQRNVDLTTDGLQAMPLNTGWVPVKACRLQDWGKLKKYVPSHKQGDVCNPPPPKLAAEFDRLRRFVLPICWVSEFRRFALAICGVSVIWPIRSANLLGPLGI